MNTVLYNPPLIEAVQRAAQSVGIPHLAAEMDMRPSSLYSQLNPYADRSVSKLGLEAALFIMTATGDVTALSMMASSMGYTLNPAARPDSLKDIPEECCEDFQALAAFQRIVRDTDYASIKVTDVLTARDTAKGEIDQTAELFLSLYKKWQSERQASMRC